MNDLFHLFYSSSGVCTDTRSIKTDCLFICLKGANFNGNTFALSALENGAKYVIVDEEEYCTHPSIYLVDNALKFLQELGLFHRRKHNIPVIGITGSNGKTSTKELIRAVLSEKYDVLATQGNLNNHIGVPLTLLNLKENHQVAIIEMGANRFKDIEELCSIAEPTHGIITNIGKAHLEGFLNFEGVLKTKTELYTAVSVHGGTLLCNADDSVLMNHLPENVKVMTYGTCDECIVQGELIGLDPFVELSWTYAGSKSGSVRTHMIGKYNFYNFLAAITAGITFDVPFDRINHAISQYIPENNRSQVADTGRNTLILDCYNANPTSMRSALESFAMMNTKNKMVIIGDMLELGKETNTEHQAILDLAAKMDFTLYTVGPVFSERSSDKVSMRFFTTTEAADHFRSHPVTGYTILLKGSRGIGLEKLQELF